jgi:hypothetical protein
MRMPGGFLLETHNKGARSKKAFSFPFKKKKDQHSGYIILNLGQLSNSTIKYAKKEQL